MSERKLFRKYFIPNEHGVNIWASYENRAIQNGMIKELGQRGFLVLTVLISYMNKNQESYPSQTKIGELIGMSTPTVRKALDDLMEHGMISRVKPEGRRNYVYKINFSENLVLDTEEDLRDNSKEADGIVPDVVFSSSRDVADYFAKKFKDVYGYGYTINFGKELSLINNKIMDQFNDEQIKDGIDVAVENYEEVWANDKYSKPTISMLSTWLMTEALNFKDKDIRNQEDLDKAIKEAQESDQSDVFLDLF